MQKRALVVVAGAVEGGQQEHGNVGNGVLRARLRKRAPRCGRAGGTASPLTLEMMARPSSKPSL